MWANVYYSFGSIGCRISSAGLRSIPCYAHAQRSNGWVMCSITRTLQCFRISLRSIYIKGVRPVVTSESDMIVFIIQWMVERANQHFSVTYFYFWWNMKGASFLHVAVTPCDLKQLLYLYKSFNKTSFTNYTGQKQSFEQCIWIDCCISVKLNFLNNEFVRYLIMSSCETITLKAIPKIGRIPILSDAC